MHEYYILRKLQKMGNRGKFPGGKEVLMEA